MKAYICDGCGEVILDPYEVNMKEFNLIVAKDSSGEIRYPRKKRVKVHLCEDCLASLYRIAYTVMEDDTGAKQ